MYKISLMMLLAAAVLVSGCHTKGYVRAMQARQAQSASNANQIPAQPNK
jgi:outer membrane lipoprotein-sorting protein